MPEPDHFFANLQRGQLLLGHGRAKEALPFFQAAIAANPDAPQGYAELARCWNEVPNSQRKTIDAINRAIGLAPNVSFYQGLKGWFLVCQMRYREALRAAQQGLAIDPNCVQSLNALANGHTKLNQWKKAEITCRRILEIEPYDGPGLNLLAQALRHQGKWKETREVVARLLANMPNNSFGHANAGYAAFAAGDHLRADEHFMESLRLDPQSNLARQGLLQSLRTRAWLTRFNRRVFSFMRLPATPLNLAIALLVTMSTMGVAVLSLVLAPDIAGPVVGLLFAYLILHVTLSALTGMLGHTMLLFHPLGRHALSTREKRLAIITLGAFSIGILMLFVMGQWGPALVLLIVLAVLAFTIQFPLLRDGWLRRRASQSES